MHLLYSVMLTIWGILLLPLFMYKAWRRHKRLPGLRQRFGRLADALKFDGRQTIWFHSCSVGETLSLEPLAAILHELLPDARFVFSTITETGQTVAKERFARYGEGNSFYFPIDFVFSVRRALDWIKPSMVVIIDTEIWANFVREAHRRSIPVIMANGRISAHSFPYYRLARMALRKVFSNYRLLMMQSDEDAERISLIGAPSEKIIVSGNLKFDRNLHDDGKTGASADDLKAWLGPAQNGDMLIAAGSTHPGEEERLLEALHLIRQTPGLGRVRLLLAPRHPERSQEIATTIRQKSFTISRRSSWTRDGNAPPADILLLDTIGELAAAYQFADVVFIGGTLVDHGGHSIMEPAFYAKPIVTGPSMQNFRGIMDEFLAKRAIRQISARSDDPQQQTQELKEELHNLLTHEEERNAMGRAARSILERNSGAAQRTAEKIAACFVTTKGTKNTK